MICKEGVCTFKTSQPPIRKQAWQVLSMRATLPTFKHGSTLHPSAQGFAQGLANGSTEASTAAHLPLENNGEPSQLSDHTDRAFAAPCIGSGTRGGVAPFGECQHTRCIPCHFRSTPKQNTGQYVPEAGWRLQATHAYSFCNGISCAGMGQKPAARCRTQHTSHSLTPPSLIPAACMRPASTPRCAT